MIEFWVFDFDSVVPSPVLIPLQRFFKIFIPMLWFFKWTAIGVGQLFAIFTDDQIHLFAIQCIEQNRIAWIKCRYDTSIVRSN